MAAREPKKLTRRAAVGLLAAGSAGLALGACQSRRLHAPGDQPEPGPESLAASGPRMPSIFLAHGAPMLIDDRQWVGELRRWAQAMPRPRSILMLSAHWEQRPVTLGATRALPLIYDFYGFPERYYRMKYPAPGAPELAARVRQLLAEKHPVASAPERGLDHGAYVPLMAMYPDADVPVLQASLPSLEPREVFELGRALGSLREQGVLIVGSGFLTHNLRALDFSANATPPQWAAEFDAFCAEALAARDVDMLLDYRARAPGVSMALPTHEHFVPVLAALGAAIDTAKEVTFPITGFMAGSCTKRSVQLS